MVSGARMRRMPPTSADCRAARPSYTQAVVNEHLMRALLYAAVFFETSTEEQCDLDTAVKQLEGIHAELDGLTAAEKAEFRAFAHREASKEPAPHLRQAIGTFIDSLRPED
jgi:hypothetical protein